MTTTRIADARMKVAQISKPGADFEIVEAYARTMSGNAPFRVVLTM